MSDSGIVEFSRGGKRVKLIKDPCLFAVKTIGGAQERAAVHAALTQRDGCRQSPARSADGLMMISTRSESVRGDAMDVARELPGVAYCTRVLRRENADDDWESIVEIQDKIFVEYSSEPSEESVEKVEQKHNIRRVFQVPDKPEGVVYQLTRKSKKDPIAIAEELRKQIGKDIAHAEPCLAESKPGQSCQGSINFARQWHLLNLGLSQGKMGIDCNVVDAWRHTCGNSGVIVAIIDDGFDMQHPDLSDQSRIVAPYNPVDGNSDVSPRSTNDRHGTACAGIAVASRKGDGIDGVAPGCSWMPIRRRDRVGDFAEALAFFHAFFNKADVINCSWAPRPRKRPNEKRRLMPSLTRFAIDLCAEKGRYGKGIPIVFAAGNHNDSLEVNGYANYKNVFAVSSCTDVGRKPTSSNFGARICVCAPSGGGRKDIYTTDLFSLAGNRQGAGYRDNFNGTSAAAAVVSGVIALMLSANPELAVANIRSILQETAVQVDTKAEKTEGPDRIHYDRWSNAHSYEYDEKTKHSKVYGYGLVNAGKAVEESKRHAAAPEGNVREFPRAEARSAG